MEQAKSIYYHNQHVFDNPNTDHIFYLNDNGVLCFVNSAGEYGTVNYITDYINRNGKDKPSNIAKGKISRIAF